MTTPPAPSTLRQALQPLAAMDCEAWGCPTGPHDCPPANARAALAHAEPGEGAAPQIRDALAAFQKAAGGQPVPSAHVTRLNLDAAIEAYVQSRAAPREAPEGKEDTSFGDPNGPAWQRGHFENADVGEPLVEMACCGFRFSSYHSDDAPDNRKGHVIGGSLTYSCPMCAPREADAPRQNDGWPGCHEGLTAGYDAGCVRCAYELGRRREQVRLGATIPHAEAMRMVGEADAAGPPDEATIRAVAKVLYERTELRAKYGVAYRDVAEEILAAVRASRPVSDTR